MKKIYICTPLKREKFLINEISRKIIDENAFAFIPPTEQLLNKSLGAKIDKMMIELCDELWVFGSIGRDCAWEIGFAQGLGKKVKFHKSKENEHVLNEDWMTTINIEIIDIETE